jgi:hypothetical protein
LSVGYPSLSQEPRLERIEKHLIRLKKPRFPFGKALAKNKLTMKTPDPFLVLKDIKLPLVIAFMGFIGGITGSLAGPYLSAQHEKEKEISKLRVGTYTKFFEGQAKLLQVRYTHPTGPEAEGLMRDYQQKIKEARFEIGVFGSPAVIQALVNWFTAVSRADTRTDLWKEDVKIYQAMRKEILDEQGPVVEDHDLYNLLFRYDEAALR